VRHRESLCRYTSRWWNQDMPSAETIQLVESVGDRVAVRSVLERGSVVIVA